METQHHIPGPAHGLSRVIPAGNPQNKSWSQPKRIVGITTILDCPLVPTDKAANIDASENGSYKFHQLSIALRSHVHHHQRSVFVCSSSHLPCRRSTGPGALRSAASSSGRVEGAKSLLTSSTWGTLAMPATGTKSRSVSKPGLANRPGFMVMMLAEVSSHRLLPASARATWAAPTLPPPPLRFSTTTGLPSSLRSSGSMTRATMSLEPPGAAGTTRVTSGGGAAWAGAPASVMARAAAVAARASSVLRRVMVCLRRCVGWHVRRPARWAAPGPGAVPAQGPGCGWTPACATGAERRCAWAGGGHRHRGCR
ncbi:hypothetical protein FQR65_LT19663 [Abscondita terminalis]|nr:hypothetical protein FQR65_LT19663 [Abscondita terminalis]